MAKSAWRRIAAGGLAAVCVAASPAAAAAEDAPRMVTGVVSSVSSDVVSIAGHRLVITPATTAVSDGRTVSPSSIRPGTVAAAEFDASGRLLHVEAKGVVE